MDNVQSNQIHATYSAMANDERLRPEQGLREDPIG